MSGRSQKGPLLSKNFLQALRLIQWRQAPGPGKNAIPNFYFNPLSLFMLRVLLGMHPNWHQKKEKKLIKLNSDVAQNLVPCISI